MKKPFKKEAMKQTIGATVLGGAANAAVDIAFERFNFLSDVDQTYIDLGKVVLGALVGSMSKSKTVHAITDGIAVVGASSLATSLINKAWDEISPSNSSNDNDASQASGLPYGTVGRAYAGDPYYRKHARKGFTVGSPFVGK